MILFRCLVRVARGCIRIEAYFGPGSFACAIDGKSCPTCQPSWQKMLKILRSTENIFKNLQNCCYLCKHLEVKKTKTKMQLKWSWNFIQLKQFWFWLRLTKIDQCTSLYTAAKDNNKSKWVIIWYNWYTALSFFKIQILLPPRQSCCAKLSSCASAV